MDSQRELLDSLMGINRNNDREEDQVTDYRDDRVCKFFLAGKCPNDLFVNTKIDEGPCKKLHSEELQKEFQRNTRDVHMYDSIIEREFTARINEVERVIKRARARVEEEKADETINPEINPDMLRIHADMSRVIANAEEALLDDDIDRVQDLILQNLDELEREKSVTMNRIMERKRARPGGPDKKLRVCDVCGSMLSIFDSDKRLTDHFLGKQHIGYQYMRDTVAAIIAHRDSHGGSGSGRSHRDRSSSRDNHPYYGSRGGGGGGRDNRDSNYYRSSDRDRDRNGGGGGWDSRERGRGDSRDRDGDSRDHRGRDYRGPRGGGGGGGGGNRGSNSRRERSRDRGGYGGRW